MSEQLQIALPKENVRAPEQAYRAIESTVHCDFWGTPSFKGLEMLRSMVDALMKFKMAELYSGELYWTYITVGEKVTQLKRRIDQWERVLNSPTAQIQGIQNVRY